MKSSLNALVVDDEPQVSGFVTQVLTSDGWKVSEARTAEQAFEMLQKQRWSLVFCDVMLGGADGYAVLRRFLEQQPEARFVLMTGHGSAAGALDATAIGAYDYLVKPFTIDDILNISAVVREQHKLRANHEKSNRETSFSGYKSDIPLIGKSPKFVECLKLVGRVAPTNLPVLIAGESGTGKEVVARAIHQRSARSSGAFVTVNCGAIPIGLIESELFGHAKDLLRAQTASASDYGKKQTAALSFLMKSPKQIRFFKSSCFALYRKGRSVVSVRIEQSKSTCA